ncbi:hypothetical protein [Methylobacterium sp. JK268]
MARGGRRVGAGRKPGSATRKTRAIADLASASGLTPLSVMLEAMRFHHALARSEIAKGDGMMAKVASEAMVAAASVAKDAAPYMHPRLAPVPPQGSETADDVARKIREALARANAIEEGEGGDA